MELKYTGGFDGAQVYRRAQVYRMDTQVYGRV